MLMEALRRCVKFLQQVFDETQVRTCANKAHMMMQDDAALRVSCSKGGVGMRTA